MARCKIFISQPMHGRTIDQIKKEREEVHDDIQMVTGLPVFDIIDNLQENEEYIAGQMQHPRLWYLGNSIKMMGDADAIVFVPGWQDSQGCLIEFMIAKSYNLPMYFLGSSQYIL